MQTVVVTLLLANLFPLGWKSTLAVNEAFILCMPVVLFQSTRRVGSPLTSLLERPPIRGLGRISYSLYLWQQLFLTPEQRIPPPEAVLFEGREGCRS
jgi:peptidoglycan/LPS O-acetylase OafA/YrhL